jgi:hypothetical protein
MFNLDGPLCEGLLLIGMVAGVACVLWEINKILRRWR